LLGAAKCGACRASGIRTNTCNKPNIQWIAIFPLNASARATRNATLTGTASSNNGKPTMTATAISKTSIACFS
jgi:hypothetical protein